MSLASLVEALSISALVCAATLAFLLMLLHLLTRDLGLVRQAEVRGPMPAPVSPAAPQFLRPALPPPRGSPSTSLHSDSSQRRLLRTLGLEACGKAKDAGRHPSYVPLCLDLVHHYSLNVNTPLLSNGLTIFLCSCLSGSPDLVSALEEQSREQERAAREADRETALGRRKWKKRRNPGVRHGRAQRLLTNSSQHPTL